MKRNQNNITVNPTWRELCRFWRDIMRDKNSSKYSFTKVIALIGAILLTVVVICSLVIMIRKQEIDHVLIVELIAFILTLLGFKNNFGYATNSRGEQQIVGGSNDDGNNNNHNDYNNNYDNNDNDYNNNNDNYSPRNQVEATYEPQKEELNNNDERG
jgi:hypothetical protein